MPKYTYKCDSCEQVFDVRHSFEEECVTCLMCGATEKPTRVPASVFFAQNHAQSPSDQPPGVAVKRAIEEAREDLKADREALRGREYKDD